MIFNGFFTDLEEFSRKKFIFGKSHGIKETLLKNSFREKFVCIPPTVRCTGISKKPVEIYGGLFGASQTDSKEGNFFSWYQIPLYQYKKTDIAVETP